MNCNSIATKFIPYVHQFFKTPTVFEVVNMCPCIRLMHITLAYTIKYPMTDCFINANLLSEKPSIF